MKIARSAIILHLGMLSIFLKYWLLMSVMIPFGVKIAGIVSFKPDTYVVLSWLSLTLILDAVILTFSSSLARIADAGYLNLFRLTNEELRQFLKSSCFMRSGRTVLIALLIALLNKKGMNASAFFGFSVLGFMIDLFIRVRMGYPTPIYLASLKTCAPSARTNHSSPSSLRSEMWDPYTPGNTAWYANRGIHRQI